MSARHHAEWLSLIEISGPFLSMPVLLRVFPQGLDADDPERRHELSIAYDEWRDNQLGPQPETSMHRAWVLYVLRRILEFPDEVIVQGQSIPQNIMAEMAEHGETLRPDFVILDPDSKRPRLLVQYVPVNQPLDKPFSDRLWKASPDTRMMELLHATNVPLGLATNGEQWMLVHAPRGETTGFISWYGNLWLEELMTLRAFRSLLGVRRFFGVGQDETLEAMLAQSVHEQQEVTDQLGYQVREAVSVLIQTMDRADRESDRRLLKGVTDPELYEAALTVMMRLVFLFSAEERGLFPLDDPFYSQYYAASTLRAQLREAADQFGEEVIERRFDAWCRLLAIFRVIHDGVQHDRLRLPPYGGSLFDPNRFPFLEGRKPGTDWKDAEPFPIDNRTVLHLLESLQLLQVKVPGGGPAEARRLSFRALDIEQIGHVYEGLLDHTAKQAEAVVLGLKGTRDKEPEIPLPELEGYLAKGEEALIYFLRDQTGRSASALGNDLKAEPDAWSLQSLRVACGNNEAIYRRVLPFAGIIRKDAFGQPAVILPGSFYVTSGVERRKTGTHYTPRSLTEPIVQHTLEPQVYDGPAEGKPQSQWKLRSPERLLNLKICDMAMGSGAFLVQTCRYLSERLVESWEYTEENLRRRHGKSNPVMITPEGKLTDDLNKTIPMDTGDRLILARRLIADRCLYGVDKNPLAVEMAKLSIWLITLDKNRPFSFLDHAFKCGDSIVGVNLDQLHQWNLDAKGTPELISHRTRLEIESIIQLRREIEKQPVNNLEDQRHKEYLLTKANAIAHDLRRGGDMLIASYWNDLPKSRQDELRIALLAVFRDGRDLPAEWHEYADLGDLRPFHWELEFPEVFLDEGHNGFDAIIGNPPFMRGKSISTNFGDNYLKYLKTRWNHQKGSADYCAYFFLRAFENIGKTGFFGLLATNTIAQGDTREFGLDYLVKHNAMIYNAINSRSWPGMASVAVSIIHISKTPRNLPLMLDGKLVDHISSLLDSQKTLGNPHHLIQNEGISHMGSIVLGTGFILSPDKAQELINKDPKNAEVIFPYLRGEDFNTIPDHSPSWWAINFFDWPLELAEKYSDCMNIIREKVKPQRDKVKRKVYREIWWQYAEKQKKLYETIEPLHRVLFHSFTSKYLCFGFVPTGMVYAGPHVVIALSKYYHFAVLQSSFHENWVRKYCSTLETRLRYAASDVFETFPFPKIPFSQKEKLDKIGENFYEHRRQIMLTRWEGLTQTYNRFHNPDEGSEDIKHLRELHIEMDQSVALAYGWDDLDLGHNFHETPQGIRFTISEPTRLEVLDRLLELNHQRYEEEVKAGLHDKKRGKKQQKLINQVVM